MIRKFGWNVLNVWECELSEKREKILERRNKNNLDYINSHEKT